MKLIVLAAVLWLVVMLGLGANVIAHERDAQRRKK